jgi:hypothetical protein
MRHIPRTGMTAPSANPTPARIRPTEAAEAASLSKFLIEGFQLPPGGRGGLTAEMLAWKYFAARGHATGARSFVIEEGERWMGHIGVTTTDFVLPADPEWQVSAVHPVDWLATQTGGMAGTMLMLKAFGQARVQYSTGSTEAGNRILRGCGFTEIAPLPNYYKFLRPTRWSVWNFIHGRQKFPRSVAMYLVDMARAQVHPGRGRKQPVIQARRVERFAETVTQVFRAAPADWICTSRRPELLNYLLAAPENRYAGWLLEQGTTTVGFALTSVNDREGVKLGTIADCFLPTTAPELWRGAIHAVTAALAAQECDIVRASGTAAWLQTALRANGFFRRGQGGFFLRDPQKLIPRDRRFHVTLLDGDLAN